MIKDKTVIFTTQPAHLTFNEAEKLIREELKPTGLKIKTLTQGSTQPNGKTLYYIIVCEES